MTGSAEIVSAIAARADGAIERSPVVMQARAIVARGAWHQVALGAIVLLSATLNLVRLGQDGIPNAYYGAAVLSMLQSWHNAFFVSFDPGGFVTVDKPPLGFWLQTLSSKLVGFSGLSVLLPEAIAGVISVVLVYLLVRRACGVRAGLVAALAMGVTPVNVATDRNNTIDSLLQLTLLVAAWATLRAAETGRVRWLVGAGALVGLGFEIKMLEAYLIVPALGFVYLVLAPRTFGTRIIHLALAALVMLGISFAWPVAVELTPSDQRPWVGSTQDNSELSLIFGYNGLQRLVGGRFGRGLAPEVPSPALEDALRYFTPGGVGETGSPGPARLLGSQLAGQVSWVLPLAVLGIIAGGWRAWRTRRRTSRLSQNVLLWSGWFATTAVFFSVAGEFHPYYMVTMSPAIAALAGIGVRMAWHGWRRGRWTGWLLPVAFAATAALQFNILSLAPDWLGSLRVVVGCGAALSAGLLVLSVGQVRTWLGRSGSMVAGALTSGVTLLLLCSPTVWAALPIVDGASASRIPVAGPVVRAGVGSGRPGRASAPSSAGRTASASNAASLADFLEAHRGHTPNLAATTNANLAAPLILATGQPVMALGGFLGRDPILTPSMLAARVQAGDVRYFLLVGQPDAAGRAGRGFGLATELTNWVANTCSVVPAPAWGGGEPQSIGLAFRIQEQLYDCGAGGR